MARDTTWNVSGRRRIWVAPPSPSNGSVQTYVLLKLESSTQISGLLDRSVELSEIKHMTCSYIHNSCYLLYGYMLDEIDIFFGMLYMYLLGFGS